MVAGIAGVVAAGLAVGALSGRSGLLVGLAAVQAGLVLAWVPGTALPGPIGGLVIGAGTAAAADTVLVLRDRTSLGALLGVLGLAFPALLLHQLSRGVVRVRVTESMSAVAGLVLLVVGASTYLAVIRIADGPRLASAALAAAGAALLAGHLTDAVLPVPRLSPDVPRGLLGLVVAVAAGAVTGGGYGLHARQFGLTGGVLLGAVGAAVAALAAIGVGYVAAAIEHTRGRWVDVAIAYLRVAVPLALTGPVAYLLGLYVVS